MGDVLRALRRVRVVRSWRSAVAISWMSRSTIEELSEPTEKLDDTSVKGERARGWWEQWT